jgi:hypothetical protein
MFTPHSVKIFRPETYAAIFHAAVVACLGDKVKLAKELAQHLRLPEPLARQTKSIFTK